MINYIIRRLLHMIPTLILISMVSFAVIQAPPGDMLTSRLAELAEQGELGSESAMAQIDALRERYGLNDPIYVQYARWIWKIVSKGDFGQSFTYEMDVMELLAERLGLHLDPDALHLDLHVDRRHTHWHLLGHAAIFHWRLRLYLSRIHRPCHP